MTEAQNVLVAYYRLYPEARKWNPITKQSKRKLFRCSHCQKETPLLLGIADELAHYLNKQIREFGL